MCPAARKLQPRKYIYIAQSSQTILLHQYLEKQLKKSSKLIISLQKHQGDCNDGLLDEEDIYVGGDHKEITSEEGCEHEKNESEAGISNAEEIVGPGSFSVIKLIGKGSFGEVYLVSKSNSKKLYAMKVLRKSQIMAQNLIKYALTERNVLTIAHHPFIVKLNYAFQTNDLMFLILDYAPGGDLGEYLQREKKFTEERTKFYLSEIILALEYLHQKGIIFRDLKPDNVVVEESGHILLTDFGLSKEGINDNEAAKSFCGSVAYLAPEILKRSGHGRSVDWYLFGVLMYELLVGNPPYFSKSRY